VGQELLPENPANGGFPEPPSGEPVRVVAARHDGCAEATRVRLPRTVPARAVRRVRCSECSRDFDAGVVQDLTAPTWRRLPLVDRFDPSSRAWQLASLGLAAAAVIGGLLLIQGGDDQPQTSEPAAALAPPAPSGDHGKGHHEGSSDTKASKHTTLVAGSSYHLALPAHWEQVDPPTGATFKAAAPDVDADVTLWIERDPGLSFDRFVSQSMSQLESLTGSQPQIVERVPAPTADNSVVKLAADAPPNQPSYEVTLRAAGDYRYYLAASVQPDASSEAADGADLIVESFTPEGS
jgi:hypothetical protein